MEGSDPRQGKSDEPPSLGEEREFNLLVLLTDEQDCGYVARKLQTQAASLDLLVNSIRHAFSIAHPIQISYFDTEYQSYVVPIQLSEIPTKGKIKVRDRRGRRPTNEDLQNLLAGTSAVQQLKLDDVPKPDSFLNSEELYQMLWTLLIVTANNLPSNEENNAPGRRSAGPAAGARKSSRVMARNTASDVTSNASYAASLLQDNRDNEELPMGPIQQFVGLVQSLAAIFPDPNTRMVLRSVLQDYDINQQKAQIQTVREVREWTRCVFSRVNEALHNTFDGEHNQHISSTQDELADFQAMWFPIADTNLSDYRLEVNLSDNRSSEDPPSFMKKRLSRGDQETFKGGSLLEPVSGSRLTRTSRRSRDDRNPIERGNSFSAIAGERLSPFATIPDEIVIYIFHFLDANQLHAVYRVCKRWAMLAEEPFLWKRIFKENWNLRTSWMGNWDMFIMYSGDNWRSAFYQWFYWELLNSLLNQADSEENIIYENENEEEEGIGARRLDMDSLIRSSLISPDEEDTTLEEDGSPVLSDPVPIESKLEERDSVEHSPSPPLSQGQGRKSLPPLTEHATRHRRIESEGDLSVRDESRGSTWKPARKRTSSHMAAQRDTIEPRKNTLEGVISNSRPLLLRVHRNRSFRFTMFLLAEAISPNCEPFKLLPDIGLLLPPCLQPKGPTFVKFDLPPPHFQQRSANTSQCIKRATLMKLVEHLTTPYSHDLQYMKIFMLTYIYFTTPETLLKILIRRFFVSPGKENLTAEDTRRWEERIKMPITLRVFNILKFWLENYEMDFDHHLMTCLKEFAQKALPPLMAKQILKVIVSKRSGGGKPRTVSDFQFNAAPPYPDVPKNIFSQTLQLWDISDLEIARQLTVIQFNLFSAIRPRELLNQSWKRPNRRQGSPNVLKMLARFQDLSSKWVPQMMERAPLIKQKVKVLKRFINIAIELLKLNNFHDAMSIYQGIKMEYEIRYPRIWQDLPNKFKKDYQQLEALMIFEDQYKAQLPNRHPCIPYLDYHLKKLVAVEALVPSTIGHMVNFTKCRYVYKIISELIRFQQTPYNLQPVTQIADLLTHFDMALDDDTQANPETL